MNDLKESFSNLTNVASDSITIILKFTHYGGYYKLTTGKRRPNADKIYTYRPPILIERPLSVSCALLNFKKV